MAGITDYFKEKKPKIRKPKKKLLKWWERAAIALVAIAILIPSAAFFIEKNRHVKTEAKYLSEITNLKKDILMHKKGKENLIKLAKDQKAEIKKLNSFTNACLEKRNVSLIIAKEEKAYAKNMERLALSHAAKFQKLRIENDRLRWEKYKKRK